MSGNVFFNQIPSHSRWFIPIPIPNPRFSLALFPFPSHSRWLFPFPPAPILLLLVVSQMTGELNNAQSSTVIKRKTQQNPQIKQYQSKQCLMDIQSET